MPQVSNYITKTFTEPQTRFEIAINFPQGARRIRAKGSNAGKSYRVDILFTVELQYSGETTWNPLAPIVVGGIYKDGFVKVQTYHGTTGTVNFTDYNSAFDQSRAFSVRIKRNTDQVDPTLEPEDPDYKYYYTSVLQTITGYKANTKAVTDPKGTELAKTALSILATKQINGQIEGINGVVQTYCLDWNGTNWVMANTNNPASLFRYILTHPANPQRILESEVSSKIDLQKLQYWHSYCSSRTVPFAYNGVVGNTRSLLEVLRDVCSAGRASPALVDGKWSVNIDEAKSVIVQHFTPHNSWGFESVKALPKIPDALKIQFFNEEADYKEDELIVYNYGKDATTAEIFESITLPGITKKELVKDHGQWHFAQIKLRPEIYSLNTDVEYLVCNRGDRVKVTHDVPMWGVGSGRIKNRVINTQVSSSTVATSTCFDLDEPILIDQTKNYTVRVRAVNGDSNTRQLKKQFSTVSYSYSGNTVTVTLDSQDHPLQVGNTVSITIAAAINGEATITEVSGSTIKYVKSGLTGSLTTTNTAGTLSLVSGYYSRIQLVASLTYAQCAPLDLFLFGELNAESQDLIVLSVEPTNGSKNARLTLVDYGVTSTYNIFTDYKDLSSATFDTLITDTNKIQFVDSLKNYKPEIVVSKINSNQLPQDPIFTGVYVWGIYIPFTNPIDAPDSAEYVEAEYCRTTLSDPVTKYSERVSSQVGSVVLRGVDVGGTYRIRLRYVTQNGIVGMWSNWTTHTVTGKLTVPSNVTGFSYTAVETGIKFTWTSATDPDYSYTEIRTGNSWSGGTSLFKGSTNTWTWIKPGNFNDTVRIKHFDISGNQSTTDATLAINYNDIVLASISADLSNPTQNIYSNSDGSSPILTNSGTTITVTQGGTVLRYDGVGTANGRWKIESKTDSGVTSGSIVAVSDATNGDVAATINNLTSFANDTGTVTYVISGKSTLGTSFSITRTQRYVKAKQGSAGNNGINTAQIALYNKNTSSTSAPAAFSGTFTYTFSTNTLSGGTLNGWTTTAPSIGKGEYLWVRYAVASSNTATDTIPSTEFSSAAVLSSGGIDGVKGDKTITVSAFIWSNSGTPAIPSTTATYNWTNKTVNTYPTTAGVGTWQSSAPSAPGNGYTLYQAFVLVSDVHDATSTSFNWNTATIGVFGFRQDGTPGVTGNSYRIAYSVTTSATAPGAVTAGTGDVPPTSPGTWSFTATSNLNAGQYMYQVDGSYNPVTGNITWGNPYLSNLKVGSLSALAVDTGNLTVSTTGSIKNVGGGYNSDGFFLGYDSTAYKFSVGSGADKLTFDGTTLSIPATKITGLLTASQINSNGLTIKDNSGNVILGVGTNLDYTRINPSTGWVNDNIRSGGVNLVGNSGFLKHNGSLPTNWNPYNNADISVTTSVQSGGLFGQNYFRIVANADTASTLGISVAGNSTDSVKSWEPGQLYVISYWARGQNGAVGKFMNGYDSNMGFNTTTVLENPALTGNWQRYVFRGIPNSNVQTPVGELFLSWSTSGTLPAGSVIDITCPKVELGTQPSSWTPSPQDTLNNNITISSGAIQGIGTGVGTTVANNSITVAGGVLQGIGTSNVQVDNSYQTIGQNLLPNSDMVARCDAIVGWNPNNANIDVGPTLATLAGPGWTTANYLLIAGATRNGAVHQNGITSGTVGGSGNSAIACDIHVTGQMTLANGMPVTPGKRYCFSAYVVTHRCDFNVGFTWLDSTGAQVNPQSESAQTGTLGGNANRLDLYTRSHTFGTAPADAVVGFAFIRKRNTYAGEADSWLWWAAPVFEEVTINASGPSPYMAGPSTNTRQLGFTGDLDSTRGAPTGTIVGGTLAETVALNAANGNSAYNSVNDATTGLSSRLRNNAQNVLSGGAGLSTGNLTWNPSNGVRTGGYGIAITQNGINAYNSSGILTFSLDGTTGNASYAGEISASQVTAGTFSGNRIAANAITAKHVALMDLENIVTNHSGEQGGDGWTNLQGFGKAPNIFSTASEYYLYQTQRDNNFGNWFRVKPGDQFYVEFTSQPSGGGAGSHDTNFGLQLRGGDPASASGETWIAGATRLASQNGVITTGGTITVPSGYFWARVWLQQAHFSNSTGYYYKNLRIIRRKNSELIVDGAITAAKINVNDLSSINANVGTLTAGLIRNSADTFRVDVTNGRTITTTGSYMKVTGAPFGSSNQFIEWYGAYQSNLANCTEANATYYLKTNGAAYFGGSLSAGVLTNKGATSDLGGSAEIVVGPFGTNGNTKTVTLSYAFGGFWQQLQGSSTGSASGSISATIKLYRKIGNNSETEVATLNVSGTWSYETDSEPQPGPVYIRTWNQDMGGSLTYTDSVSGTDNRTYRAQITARSLGFATTNGDNSQRVEIVSIE